MNSFHYQTLKSAAEQIGLDYRVVQSPRSEAAYLQIWDNENRKEDFPVEIRFASHEPMCGRSKTEIEITTIGYMDFDTNEFMSEVSIDEDGDLVFCEEEIEFNNVEDCYNHYQKIIVNEIMKKF